MAFIKLQIWTRSCPQCKNTKPILPIKNFAREEKKVKCLRHVGRYFQKDRMGPEAGLVLSDLKSQMGSGILPHLKQDVASYLS